MISSRFSVKKFLSRGSRRETGASAEHHHQHHCASEQTNRARTSTRTSLRTGHRTWMTAGIAAMAALAAMATITATADSAQAQSVTLNRVVDSGSDAIADTGGRGARYEVVMDNMFALGQLNGNSTNVVVVRFNLAGASIPKAVIKSTATTGVEKGVVAVNDILQTTDFTVVHDDLVQGVGGYLGSGYLDAGGARDDILFVFDSSAFDDDNNGDLTFNFSLVGKPAGLNKNIRARIFPQSVGFARGGVLIYERNRGGTTSMLEDIIVTAGRSNLATHEGVTQLTGYTIPLNNPATSAAQQYRFTAAEATGPTYKIIGSDGVLAAGGFADSFDLEIENYAAQRNSSLLLAAVDIAGTGTAGIPPIGSNYASRPDTLNIGDFTISIDDSADSSIFFLTKGEGDFQVAIPNGLVSAESGSGETVRINIQADGGAPANREAEFSLRSAVRYNSIRRTDGTPSGRTDSTRFSADEVSDDTITFTTAAAAARASIRQPGGAATLAANGANIKRFMVDVENFRIPTGDLDTNGRFLGLAISTFEPNIPATASGLIPKPAENDSNSNCVNGNVSGCARSIATKNYRISLPPGSPAFFTSDDNRTSGIILMVPRDGFGGTGTVSASFPLTITAGTDATPEIPDSDNRRDERTFRLVSASVFNGIDNGLAVFPRAGGIGTGALSGGATFTIGEPGVIPPAVALSSPDDSTLRLTYTDFINGASISTALQLTSTTPGGATTVTNDSDDQVVQTPNYELTVSDQNGADLTDLTLVPTAGTPGGISISVNRAALVAANGILDIAITSQRVAEETFEISFVSAGPNGTEVTTATDSPQTFSVAGPLVVVSVRSATLTPIASGVFDGASGGHTSGGAIRTDDAITVSLADIEAPATADFLSVRFTVNATGTTNDPVPAYGGASSVIQIGDMGLRRDNNGTRFLRHDRDSFSFWIPVSGGGTTPDADFHINLVTPIASGGNVITLTPAPKIAAQNSSYVTATGASVGTHNVIPVGDALTIRPVARPSQVEVAFASPPASTTTIPTNTIDEGGETAVFSVVLDRPVLSGEAVNLPYTFSGAIYGTGNDYTYTINAATDFTDLNSFTSGAITIGAAAAGNLVFGPGDQYKVITVTALTDTVPESGGETLEFRVASASAGGRDANGNEDTIAVDAGDGANITINDPAPPTSGPTQVLSLTKSGGIDESGSGGIAESGNISEADEDTFATLTLTLDAAVLASEGLDFPINITGNNITPGDILVAPFGETRAPPPELLPAFSINVPMGSDTGTATISAVHEGESEARETMIINVVNLPNNGAGGEITRAGGYAAPEIDITDNDPLSEVDTLVSLFLTPTPATALDPAFDPAVNVARYTASYASETDGFTVIATATDAGAVIHSITATGPGTITGQLTNGSTQNNAATLGGLGDHVYIVTVTVRPARGGPLGTNDGTHDATYVIEVTIGTGTGTPTNDASLTALTLTPDGESSAVAFTPAYVRTQSPGDTEVNAYTVASDLPFGTNEVAVLANPFADDAVITSIIGTADGYGNVGDGATLTGGTTAGTAGDPVTATFTDLVTGRNTIEVLVTAGSTTRTYTITANVAASSAINTLSVTGETFTLSGSTYTINLASGATDSITFRVTPEDATGAEVNVTRAESLDAAGSLRTGLLTISAGAETRGSPARDLTVSGLARGFNVIQFTIWAADDTPRVYALRVRRGGLITTPTTSVTVPNDGSTVEFDLLSIEGIVPALIPTGSQRLDVWLNISSIDIGLGVDQDTGFAIGTHIDLLADRNGVEYGTRASGALSRGFKMEILSPQAILDSGDEGFLKIGGSDSRKIRVRIPVGSISDPIRVRMNAVGDDFITDADNATFNMGVFRHNFLIGQQTQTDIVSPEYGGATDFNIPPRTTEPATLASVSFNNVSDTGLTLTEGPSAGTGAITIRDGTRSAELIVALSTEADIVHTVTAMDANNSVLTGGDVFSGNTSVSGSRGCCGSSLSSITLSGLSFGPNVVTIIVRPAGGTGSTDRTYTITINVRSNDATLASLTLTPVTPQSGSPRDGVINTNTNTGTVAVPVLFGTRTGSLTATVSDNNAMISAVASTTGGITFTSGTNVPANNDNNAQAATVTAGLESIVDNATLTIIVTAQNSDIITYTVTVTVDPEANTRIGTLMVTPMGQNAGPATGSDLARAFVLPAGAAAVSIAVDPAASDATVSVFTAVNVSVDATAIINTNTRTADLTVAGSPARLTFTITQGGESSQPYTLTLTRGTGTVGFASGAATRTVTETGISSTYVVELRNIADDFGVLNIPITTGPVSGTTLATGPGVGQNDDFFFEHVSGSNFTFDSSNRHIINIPSADLDDILNGEGNGEIRFLFNTRGGDDFVEDPEAVTLALDSGSLSNISTAGVTQTVNITDTTTFTVAVDPTTTNVNVAEGGGVHNVSLTFSDTGEFGIVLNRQVRIPITITPGTAEEGNSNDFTAVTDDIVLSATSTVENTTTRTVAITPRNDNIVEGDETFTLTPVGSGDRAVTATEGTITIQDDDRTTATLTITNNNGNGTDVSGNIITGQTYAATVALTGGKVLAEQTTFTLTQAAGNVTVNNATVDLPAGMGEVTTVGAFTMGAGGSTFGVTLGRTLSAAENTRATTATDYAGRLPPAGLTGLSGVRINNVPTLRLVAGTDSAAQEDATSGHSTSNTATFEIQLRDMPTTYNGDVVFTLGTAGSTAVAADYRIRASGAGTGNGLISGTTVTIGDDAIDAPGNGGVGGANVTLTVEPANDNTIETTVETLSLTLGATTTAPTPFNAVASTASVTITDEPNQISITNIGNVQESLGAVPGSVVSTAVVPVTFTSERADTVLARSVNLLLDSGTPGEGIVAVGGNDGLADGVPPPTGADYEQENDIPVVLTNFTGTSQIAMVPINVLNDSIVEGPEGISILILEGTTDGTTVALAPDAAVTNHSTATITLEDNDTTAVTVTFGGVARRNNNTATATVALDEGKMLAADATFTLELLSAPTGVTLPGNDTTLVAMRQVTITAGQSTATQPVPITIASTAVVDQTFMVGIDVTTTLPAYTNSADTPSDARQAILRTLVTPAAPVTNTIRQGATVTVAAGTGAAATATDAPIGSSGSADTAEFTITLENFTATTRGGTPVTVGYEFTGGTGDGTLTAATFGGDGVGDYTVNGAYTDVGGGTFPITGAAASGTFTVDARAFNSSGTATLTLTVTPTKDNIVEPGQGVVLTLNALSHSAEGTGGTDTITINDGPPMITAAISATATVVEPESAGESADFHVPITLTTDAITTNVTLERTISLGFHTTTGGTADDDGSDFTAVVDGDVTVVLPIGQTVSIGTTGTDIMLNNDVPILGDDVVEGNETFMATVTDPNTDAAITISNPAIRPVTITDTDATDATVRIVGTARINDGDAMAIVELDAGKTLADGVTATFTLELLAPVEFEGATPDSASGEVTLDTSTVTIVGPAGASAPVSIDSSGATDGHAFRVGIDTTTTPPAYAENGATSARQATLRVLVTPEASVNETIVQGPSVELVVTGAPKDAIGSGDVVSAEYVITLSGYTTGVFGDATSADVGYEFIDPAEDSSNGIYPATFGTDYTVTGVFSETGVTLTAADIATSDNDGAGTFIFPLGVFSGGTATLTLTVTPTADFLIEHPETLNLAITSATLNAARPAPVSVIINDAEDQITSVGVSDSLDEGATSIPVTFTAHENTVLNRDVTLLLNSRDQNPATADAGVDYDILTAVPVTLPNGTVFINASTEEQGTRTTHIVNVEGDRTGDHIINNDNIVEGDEMFEIRLSKDGTEPAVMLSGGPTDVTIMDDDRATVEIVPDSTASVGTFTANVQLSDSKILPTGVTATYTLVPANGTSGTSVDLTASPPDITPVLGATVTIPAGVGVSATPATFTINPGGSGENFILGIADATETGEPVYTTRTDLGGDGRITVGAATSNIRINHNTSTLSALALTTTPSGTIDLGFASDTEAYTPSLLDNRVTAIMVAPTVTPGVSATYVISATDTNGVVAVSGGNDAAGTVSPAAGLTTTITVTVTAQDNSMTLYTIALTRSADADLCDRTQEVQAAIITALSGTPDCSAVTNANLGGLTTTPVTVDGLGGTGPTITDFAGLTALTTLNLTNGTFTSLLADVFDANTALTTLNLSGGNLESLTAGLFNDLVALQILNLENNNLASVDGAVFGSNTLLPVLVDLKLMGNDNLALTADSLDVVLSRLTDLTWPTRTATFAPGGATVGQGGEATIQVMLNGTLPIPVSIPVTGGSANGVTTTTVAIAAGQTSGMSTISATSSATDSTIMLGTPTTTHSLTNTDILAAMITASDTANVTVTVGPTASVTASSTTLAEGDVGASNTAMFTITYSNLANLVGTPILEYEFSDAADNAEFGEDYTLTSIAGTTTTSPSLSRTGRITPTVLSNAGSIVITVTATGDNYEEGDENITLAVRRVSETPTAGPTGLTFTDTMHTIVIDDGGDTATAVLSAPVASAEEGTSEIGQFRLAITGGPAAVATVTYAVTSNAIYGVNGDYTASITGGTLVGNGVNFSTATSFTIPAGSFAGSGNAQGTAEVTIDIMPQEDDDDSNSHDIALTITSVVFTAATNPRTSNNADLTVTPTGSPAIVRVVDNEAVRATLTATRQNSNDYYVPEGASGPDPDFAGKLTIAVVQAPTNPASNVVLTVSLDSVDPVMVPMRADGGTDANSSTLAADNFVLTLADTTAGYMLTRVADTDYTVTIPAARFGVNDAVEDVVLNVATDPDPGSSGTGIRFSLDGSITSDGTDELSAGGTGNEDFHIRDADNADSICLLVPGVRNARVVAEGRTNCDTAPAMNQAPAEVPSLMVNAMVPQTLRSNDFSGYGANLTMVTVMSENNSQVVIDDEALDGLDGLETLNLDDNVQVEDGGLDEVLDTLDNLTYPNPATVSLGYERSDDTSGTQGSQLGTLADGPQTTENTQRGEITVSLSQRLPVSVRVEITAVCEDDVGVTMSIPGTTGTNNMITVSFAAGNNDDIMVSVNNPTAEEFDCVFNPVVKLLETDTTTMPPTATATPLGTHESRGFMPRDGNSITPDGVLGALVNQVVRAETNNVTAEQIVSETEAITTVLAREQVGMVTRLVRQRVQDLALSRPAINTTASNAAGNDDMEVSLAQSPDNMQDFVSGLALNTARDMDAGGSYSLWARGQWVNISGSPDIGIEGFDYDGNVVGAGVGVEFRDYNSMFGIALNATRAEVDVTSTSRGKTTHEEDMFFAAPYAAWKSKFSGLTLWGTVGVGTGTAEITEADGDTADPGVTVFFTRGGMDVASEISDRTDLVFGLSGLFIDKTVEKFSLGSDSIKEINVQAGQAQVDLTAFLNFPVGDTIFRPYFGLASVHEVGDIIADDRHAMEARTGFGWDNHPWYLDVDGFYEFLREDEEAWGIFGEIRYAETNSGFQFGMTGNHGTASSMSEAATSTNTVASEFDASLGNADSEEAEWSLGAESSYSFAAPVFDRSGTAAPFISGTHAESGQTLGTGVRVGLTENIDMTVESDRHMPDNDDPYSEHAVGLNARWAF